MMNTVPRGLARAKPAIGLSIAACLVAPLVPAELYAAAQTRVPISIPMRDGKSLAADLYSSSTSSVAPVILMQTPYSKNLWSPFFESAYTSDPLLKSPDYSFVLLDWRGYAGSVGTAYAGSPTRGQDGFDAIEWIAAQPWCDGNVGTYGASALGSVQLLTAAENPPHLKACVPMVHAIGAQYEDYYPGGVYQRNRNTFLNSGFGGGDLSRDHPLYDDFWSFVAPTAAWVAAINVPMLHVSGWYDHQTEATIRDMQRIQAEGGSGARGTQKLLIGPWNHGNVGKHAQGELDYPAAEFAATAAALDFFDYHLRGVGNDYASLPAVRYFRMNDNTWQQSETWPPTGGSRRMLYLQSNGTLSPKAPRKVASVSYVADPSDPVPTGFGALLSYEYGLSAPGDLRAVESRSDVRTFTTPAMTSPLSIEGRPAVKLWIQADTMDTDLAVRLTQVYPDGRSMLLVDGIQRASLRNGYTERQWLLPEETYGVEFELPSVAVTIPTGHRLRLLVGPSNFDRFDVNMQDGSSLSDEEGATAVPGTVQLQCGRSYPSSLSIPVVTQLSSGGGTSINPEDLGKNPVRPPW